MHGARPHRRRLVSRAIAAIAFAAVLVVGCSGQGSRRPSILLVVLDTTRVDAVSSYGWVRGTTPTVDALAARGLRYTRAYAQGNWTLPSHATMFTGLLPSRHRMDRPKSRLAPTIRTLADYLQAAGYETVGVSENPFLNRYNEMTRGFGRFAVVNDGGAATGEREIANEVDAWLRERGGDRPYFLFVNVMDAHAPYEARAGNHFLPPGVDLASAPHAVRDPLSYLCRTDPGQREMAILRGLYLGEVAAADAKLGDILRRLAVHDGGEPPVTIVTSDHGEHFGEHGLVVHNFGIHEELVHVPLVVGGLPRVGPAVIDTPVALADLLPTILGWAGVPAPSEGIGRPLPTTPTEGDPGRVVVAEYLEASEDTPVPPTIRAQCGEDSRLSGDARALIGLRNKLIWHADSPIEVFDLEVDPREAKDIAGARPDIVAAMAGDLQRYASEADPPRPVSERLEYDPRFVDRLRALGYVTGSAPSGVH